MRKILILTGKYIRSLIDFFYPPFRKYVGLQFFRYGVTGAANLVFDWVLFFLVYNFVVQKRLVHLGIVTLSPHIASLFLTFPVVILTGFLLQKYVTFTTSEMRGRQQLVRYIMVVFANLLINYFGLKLLVDLMHFYPTPSKIVITLVTVIFSYFSQKTFTFKVKNESFDEK